MHHQQLVRFAACDRGRKLTLWVLFLTLLGMPLPDGPMFDSRAACEMYRQSNYPAAASSSIGLACVPVVLEPSGPKSEAL